MIAVAIMAFLAVAIVVAVAASKSGYVAWDRGRPGLPRILNETEVRTDQIPSLVEAMSRGSASVRYAALMLTPEDRSSDDDAVALQISVENGKSGFDWVLLSPRNIEDHEKFRAFARAHGVEPVALSKNGVSYLRSEPVDVAKFTTAVITDMYHRATDEPLGLVHEGFEWPQR